LILKRYLYKEILQNFLAIFLVLLLIIISLRFVRYLGYVAGGQMTVEILYQMLILRIITSMSLVIPLCLFLSLFMALGRLQRDNELIPITFAGLGKWFYFSTILKLAAAFAVLLAFLTLFVYPWAEKNIALLEQKANRDTDIMGITAGNFKEFSQGNRVLYVEGFDKKTKIMKNVFLQVTEQNSTGVLTSDTARILTDEKTGERSVSFTDGRRYVGTPNRLDYSITQFARYTVRLEQKGYDTTFRPVSRISTEELFKTVKSGKLDDKTPIIELQWRLSPPLSIILLSAFALLMILKARDIRGSWLFIIAILIFFVYNNLINIAHDMVLRGKLSSFPGLWWPHLLVAAIVLSVLFIPDLVRSVKQNLSKGSR